jgi:hypothetical protein
VNAEQLLAVLLAVQVINVAALGWVMGRLFIINRELGEVVARLKGLESSLQRPV